MLEAEAFGELLVPLPKHEGKGRERRDDAEKRHKEEKAEQDEIEESPCHRKPFDQENRRSGEWMSFRPRAFLRDPMGFVKKPKAYLSARMGIYFNKNRMSSRSPAEPWQETGGETKGWGIRLTRYKKGMHLLLCGHFRCVAWRGVLAHGNSIQTQAARAYLVSPSGNVFYCDGGVCQAGSGTSAKAHGAGGGRCGEPQGRSY